MSCCPPEVTNPGSVSAEETSRRGRRLAILTGAAFAALLAAWGAGRAGLGDVVVPLYLLAYASGGYSGAVNSWDALRRRVLNVDVLMLVAAAGAAAIGSWAEGGVLLFLFSLSETMQLYALT